MKLPNKFEFKVYDMEYYVMAKHPYDGEYYCYDIDESTEDQNESIWTAYAIKRNVNEGCWKITKDLDEPELVFPFTYKNLKTGDVFTVEKDASGETYWHDPESGWVSTVPSLYRDEEIKHNIKKGAWIVSSVGEQKPACVHDYFFGDVSHAEGEHNEAASVTPLKVEIDSSAVDEAIHKMDLLAQAVENVNISLESMQALLREIGQGGMDIVGEAEPDYKVQYKYLDEFQ